MSLDSEADRLWRAARALSEAAVTPHLPPLLFFTDPDRTPEPWIVAARLPVGAGVVYRGFGRPEAEADAGRLRAATRGANVRLLIGKDADLAAAVEADGVHLPERDTDRASDLRRRHPDWLITAAWHPARDPSPPKPQGLDALIASPTFMPGGRSSGSPLGAVGLATAVAASQLPVYALGGITAERASDLARSGACGIAAVDAIVSAWGAIRT